MSHFGIIFRKSSDIEFLTDLSAQLFLLLNLSLQGLPRQELAAQKPPSNIPAIVLAIVSGENSINILLLKNLSFVLFQEF